MRNQIHIGIACNDENGNCTGKGGRFVFETPGGFEPMLDVCAWVGFRQIDVDNVRIGHRKFPIEGYAGYVGSIIYDRITVSLETAARIINYLQERGGEVEMGESILFECFQAGAPVDASNLRSAMTV